MIGAKSQMRDGKCSMNEKQTHTMTVNGERRQVIASPQTMLMDALRDLLRLTGTKDGCIESDRGHRRWARNQSAGAAWAGRRQHLDGVGNGASGG
jgi:hypothetical protein